MYAFILKIKNTNGELFELTNNSEKYNIIRVEGLTPPPTAVNTATAGTLDGSFFNSARVEQRNLVITLVINGDIEANRQALYKIFPRKTKCTVYFKNQNRDVKIDGYVEMLEGDLFSMREQIQISIICPRPYFEAINALYTELSKIIALFEFPFSIVTPIPFSEILDYPICTINNTGDAECGTKIDIDFFGSASGLKIANTTNQTYFELDYTFQDNDHVVIDTNSGSMGVYLERAGVRSNLLNYVAKNSTWLKIIPGENIFTFTLNTGDDEDVKIHFKTSLLYGGV